MFHEFTITRKDGSVEEYDLHPDLAEMHQDLAARALPLPATYKELRAYVATEQMLLLPARQLLDLIEGYEVLPEDHTQGSDAIADSLYVRSLQEEKSLTN